MESYSSLFTNILQRNTPDAIAWITGASTSLKLGGMVRFYGIPLGGIIVNAEIYGLPDTESAPSNFYAMHIHEVGNCTPPFDQTGSHYNPAKSPHPMHAGDMPPLLSYAGFAWSIFYDGRLRIDDILNRSIIIHSNRDDFTTQPSGDAGQKIGCGVIEPFHYEKILY